VQILHGIRFPELLEWNDQRLAHSYVLPDEALADVVLSSCQVDSDASGLSIDLPQEVGKRDNALAPQDASSSLNFSS
jgi:hypothetical protein